MAQILLMFLKARKLLSTGEEQYRLKKDVGKRSAPGDRMSHANTQSSRREKQEAKLSLG